MRRVLVVLLFVLSGAAALSYQVSWTRHLVLVFGNTTRAVSLILAAYMLGLALGSEAGGRLADRARRPVLWYAGFEAAIGVFAFLFPLLVYGVRSAYLSLETAAAPVLFAGAFLVLLVPTFLMGTTLPLLVRTVVRDPARTGRDVGLLYGANIVGAVAGTAFTGFWLIEAAGVIGSTYWAAGTNFLIGALALLVPFLPEPAAAPRATGDASPALIEGGAARAALLAAFAGGLVGLAAEVVWTRLLVFFLQGFTYTFSAMLATFLLGLSLGGFVFGRLSARTRRPAVLMGRLQVAVGVAAAGVLLLLTYHFEWTRGLWTFVGDDLGVQELRPRHVATLLLSSATVLLVPAFLMGGVFPLAALAYQRGLGDLGARIGRLYAVNTVGAVLGALLAGFVMAPLLGMTWSAAVVAAAALLAGVAVLWLAGERRGPLVGWAGGAAVALTLVLVAADPARPMLLRSHVFAGSRGRENRLLETLEGTVCQVSVVENERDGYYLLYTDEFQAAGTKPEYRYMRMLAHLPVALAADPSRVLVICWGTGTTAGSASTHPAVKRLDVVEISPQVLEVAGYFEHVNRGILRAGARAGGREDLEIATHVDDGRNFVLRSRDQWGVISLEPLMPYTPAAIHFYTEDFYRECVPRLAPGGVMCQWIPLQGLSRAHLRQLVSAFVRVFPGSVMFHVDGAVALIGGNAPVELDHARVAARLGSASVRADLATIGYDDPVRALGTFVAGGAELAAFGDVEPMTDEHPVLEFYPIPLNVQLKHLWENLGAMRELRESYRALPVSLPGGRAGALEDSYLLARDVGNLVLEGAERLEEAGLLSHLQRRQAAVDAMNAARRALAQAVALDPDDPAARRAHDSLEREWNTIVALGALDRGEFEEAEAALLRAADYPALRQADVVPTRLAEVRNRAERFEDAVESAIEATRLFPGGLEARAERAYARSSLGDVEGAARDYRRALAGEPPETLEDVRLRHDAQRVFASAGGADPPPVSTRIEAALGGEAVARLPAPLVLRLLAADHPRLFAEHFADDVARLADTSGDPADRMLSLKRLQLGAPPAAARAALDAASASGTPARLAAAAARAVGELAPRELPKLLDATVPQPALEAAIGAAAVDSSALDDDLVDRLLDLLRDERASVRRSAKHALFSLSDGRCTPVGALDTDAAPDGAYVESVETVRDWWREERQLRALRPR